jgi:hypothetical protein
MFNKDKGLCYWYKYDYIPGNNGHFEKKKTTGKYQQRRIKGKYSKQYTCLEYIMRFFPLGKVAPAYF